MSKGSQAVYRIGGISETYKVSSRSTTGSWTSGTVTTPMFCASSSSRSTVGCFTTFWPNFFVSCRARRVKAGYSVSSGGGGPSCVEKVPNQPAMYNWAIAYTSTIRSVLGLPTLALGAPLRKFRVSCDIRRGSSCSGNAESDRQGNITREGCQKGQSVWLMTKGGKRTR